MAYGDDGPLLGGGNKWMNALALLGAGLQDVGGSLNGRPTNALLGTMAMQEKMRQQQRQQAEQNSQQSAQAALLGGLDPTTGITWNQPRQGASEADQKALFMRAFPEAGAKAAAASLFPKPLDPKDRYMAVGDSLVDLTKPGAGPVYQAPSPFLFPGAAGMSAAGGGTGGTTTQPRGPAAPSAGVGGFGAALAQSENSGRVSGFNRQGYGGKYQFGEAALQDAGVYTPGSDPKDNAWLGQFNVPGMPEVKTAKDFFGNEAAQDAVFGVYKGGLEKQIADRGLDRFIGQTVGGAPITKDGIIAMMHLGGPTGAEKFLTSGGTYNPADSNGTRLSDYASKFARTQIAQANTGTMTDAMPAAPAAPAGQWVRPMNRKTGQMAEFEVNTATGASRPYQKPPEGYQWAADGKLAPIPGGPKDDSGGGPFAGNAMDAQASNIVITAEQRMASGENLTPQERYTYEIAKRHLMQPRVVPGPDGSLQSVAPTPLPAFPAQPPASQPQQAATPQAPASPPGQPAVTTIMQGQQKPTNEQSLAAGFGNRLATANQIFADLEAKGYVVPGLIDRAAGATGAGNWIASSEFQQMDQAQREFINAQLRRESGAAIAESEFDNARKQYFPQPGDSPEVLAQKKRSRELALENMRLAAGPLGGRIAQPQAPAAGGGLSQAEQQELEALRRKYRGG